jgi:hypothetical protein
MSTLYTGSAPGVNAEVVRRVKELKKDNIKIFLFDGYKNTRTLELHASNHYVESWPHKEVKSTEESETLCDLYIEKAEKSLNYGLSHKGQFHSLLRSFYYTIKDTESLYIVGDFCNHNDIHVKSRLGIKGKTAWYAEMFTDMCIERGLFGLLPLYFYSQQYDKWFQLTKSSNFSFIPLEGFPKSPSGNYSFIGSRNMTSNGQRAINELIN